MLAVYGIAISAEEIERVLSREFDARRFASLCNAVTWCSSRQRSMTIPAFTERVNVRDDGIDAAWDVNLAGDHVSASGLIADGWNVFQYKQRDVFAQGRAKTYSNIKSDMNRALKALYENTHQRPARYVLFTNLDLTPAQNGELCEAILLDYDQKNSVTVSVIGAAELAAFLTDLPHVRAAYFDTDNFCTWEIAQQRHEELEAFSNGQVELVGRDEKLNELRHLVDDPQIKVIVLSGPQGIGKTRLTLHSTEHRATATIVALDSDISSKTLRQIATPETEVILIVEDPDPETAEALVENLLSHNGIKAVITFPTSENAPQPNFGLDSRLRTLQINPLDEMQSHELFKNANAALDYGIESWVIEHAGGNPRILLLAANLGEELRDRRHDFIETISQAFERKVRTRYGEDCLEVLRRLSLLSQVGVRNNAQAEIDLVCDVFGGTPDISTILDTSTLR